jgi:hypothetical protein
MDSSLLKPPFDRGARSLPIAQPQCRAFGAWHVLNPGNFRDMTSADVMHIFEALIALALIGLGGCGLMQNKISAKLEKNYPAESARLSDAAVGVGGRFNYASIIWLVTGDYRSLNDPQIDSWARVARAALFVGAFAAVVFFMLLAYGRYRAHSM